LVDRQFNETGPFVVNGKQIFWLAFNGNAPFDGPSLFMRRCTTESCAATIVDWAVASQTQSAPGPLLSDSTRLFWPSQNGSETLDSCAMVDCSAPTPLTLPPRVASYAVSGNLLIGTTETGLLECSTADCASTAHTVSVVSPTFSDDLTSWEVVADSDYAYLTNSSEIVRLRIDGSGAPQVIVQGQHDVASLTVRGDSVYWTQVGPLGAIRTCPKTGCVGEPREIIGGRLNPRSLAIDDQSIYFVEGAVTIVPVAAPTPVVDEIYRCPISGSTEPTLMAKNQGAGQLEVDDKYLYFGGGACADGKSNWQSNCGFIAVVPK